MDEIKKLVRQIQRTKNPELFCELIEKVGTRLFTFIRRRFDEATAKDIFQDCSLIIWQQIDSLRDPATFLSWAYRIIENKMNKVARQRRPGGPFFETIFSAAGGIGLSEDAEAVKAALIAAGEDCLEINLQHYVDRMTWEEIGSGYGATADAMQKRAERCREGAREWFRKNK